jgi:nucleotide-binding universal stress UspA family protein
MKKVLIALDYYPTSQKVAETGYEIAQAMNAQVILLHVTSDASYYSSLNYSPIMGFGGVNSIDTVQTDNGEVLTKVTQGYLDKLKRHLGDREMLTMVKSGVFGETILNTAAEVKADIIIMGTHSRRGREKILVGSVAENVLHHSSIPVLIIPIKSNKEEKII